MKLKLLINRFVETDSIEVPIQVTTQFDPTGLTQMKKAVGDVESSFKKLYFQDNSSKTTIPFAKAQSKPYQNILSNLKARANSRISDFYSMSPNQKYDSTIASLKDSIKDYTPPVKVKDLFGRNDETIFETTKNYETLIDKFKESLPTIQSVDDKLKDTFRADQMKELQEQTKEAVSQFLYMNKELKDTEESSKMAESGLQRLSKLLKGSLLVQIQALAHTLRRIFHFLEESFIVAGDYVESINLYTMSVGEYATVGKKWAEEISDALYLDTSEIYQYTGQFYNLTRGLGASARAADLMSRNLTQLTYDMSSYLNIDVSVANNKLMSAMSGQTKAVTSVGIAVQSASLQELAYSLGIDKAVESMTQAEKTYLRYIQIMRTTTQMQGDLGRTIITPTNTMRLLRTQLNLLSRAIGQVFTPIIMNALPYVIAFTQALTELATWLAGKMGYKLEDYLAPADSIKELSDNFEDLGDAAKGAGDKINRTLAPFDELNVVQKTSTGSGGGLDDSVLDQLEQYLTGYDMLEFYTTQMKDKIEGIKDGLKSMLPLVEGIGLAFLSWKIGSSVIDFFTNNKGILTQKLGLTLMIGGVALIWKGTQDLDDNFMLGLAEKLGGTLSIAAGTYMLTKKFLLALAVTGISLLTQSFIDRDKFELSIAEALGGSVALGGTTYMLTRSATLSIAVTGLSFIGEGLAQLMADIGPGEFTGHFGEFVNQVKDLSSLVSSYDPLIQKAEEFNTTLKNQYDAIKEVRDANLVLVDNHKSLYDELQNLVDENGNVKQGYEDRVQFILNELKSAYGIEYELVNGQIVNYDKLKDSIEKVIAKKKLEILLEANKDAYIIALKNEKKADDALTEAQKDVNVQKSKLDDLEKKLTEARAKANDKQGKSIKQLIQEAKELERVELEYNAQQEVLKKSEKQRDEYQEAVYRNTEAIKNYESGMAASYSDNMQTIMDVTDQMTGHNKQSLKEQIENTITGRDKVVDYWKRTTGEITNNEIEEKKKQVQNTVDSLKNQSQTVKDLTPDVVDAWKSLAQLDKDAFENGIKDLPEDVRKKLTTLPTIIQNDLYGNMSSVGASLGKAFGDGVSKNMKINGTTFNETLTDAIKNVKIPRWLKDTPIGKMASSLGFQFAADGGMFDTGEMFIAREAGPEMVGKIGNKTAVANNDQIATALTNAIIVGLNDTNINNKQPVHNTIYIGNKKVFDGMNDYVDSENDRYGTNYIRV